MVKHLTDWQQKREQAGAAFRDRYLSRGYNQAALAAASGVSVATIRKIEKAAPQSFEASTLYRLAEIIGWEPRQFVAYAAGERDELPNDAEDRDGVEERLDRLEEQMHEVLERLGQMDTPPDGDRGGQ